MALDLKKIVVALGILLVLIGGVSLYLHLRGGSAATPGQQTGAFGMAGEISSGGGSQSVSGTLPVFTSASSTAPVPPVFKIADGPMVTATLIAEGEPTTTVARYVTGTDGHVLDLPLDVPGAIPRIVSNTTIPGVERGIWTNGGQGIILQYLDGATLKSVYLALASYGASSTQALSVHFLPDNLIDLAASPNGTSIAYLVSTNVGADGYVAAPDGGNTKKLFSVPLSQLTLSWPAPSTLLVTSKSASGVPGITFSVNAKTGAVSPLLYGLGLTATGNSSFSYALYRTDDGSTASLYAQKISGAAALITLPAPLDAPLPEQCVWSAASSTLAYCGTPTASLPAGYLDLWHRGQSSVADTLVTIDTVLGNVVPLYTPGTRDGGEPSDMIDLSLSPDGHYLSFIAKDDQTLWGIRL